MNKVVLYYLTLIIQCASLIALHRDYDGEDGGWYKNFCTDHCYLPHHACEILPYLSLIPVQEEIQCKNVDCYVCDKVWIADGIDIGYSDDDGSNAAFEKPYWMCECKEEEFEEMLENEPAYICMCGRDSCYCECDIFCRFEWRPTWTQCTKKAIWGGYFSLSNLKYFRLFRNHLEYVNENKACTCYWPEKSAFAAKMNDKAYIIINRLLTETALAKLLEDEILQQEIHGASKFCDFNIRLSDHETTRALICQCFLYSDYDQVLEELDHVSKNHLSASDYARVKDDIEKARLYLYSNFITLNRKCYEKHPHPRIAQEIKFINMLTSLHKLKQTEAGQ